MICFVKNFITIYKHSLKFPYRFKCHKKCSRKAPPSCGLPPALEKIFIAALRDSGGDGESKAMAFVYFIKCSIVLLILL